MADGRTNDRTEQATPRKREETRRKGQIPTSSELNSGGHLLVAALLLWLTGEKIGPGILNALREWLSAIGRVDGNVGQIQKWMATLAWGVFSTSGLILGVLFASGVLIGCLQTGFHFSAQSLRVDWSKLSPLKGFGRIFSTRSVMKGVAALLKLLSVVAIVGWVLYLQSDLIATSAFRTLGGILTLGWDISTHLILAVAAALLIIGGLDYIFQRWKHDQDLMMSKQEVKDEHKDVEGDPLLKARIRKLQRETSQRTMMKSVPDATVVITNPTHLSIALKYDSGSMETPQVVAKGAGAMALKIRKIAAENSVPIVEKKPLARALYGVVDVGEDIPVELFQAVAEILIYVYSLKRSA
ncbi:MAG: flagellar biosynthesis protein FlhB [Planctomycetaceae bacterium]